MGKISQVSGPCGWGYKGVADQLPYYLPVAKTALGRSQRGKMGGESPLRALSLFHKIMSEKLKRKFEDNFVRAKTKPRTGKL